MFSIYDGRDKFYQWDKDRKLIVEDKTITQVHFANCLCPNATVCEVKDGVADVPNELLTQDLDIRVWAYDGEMTKHEQVFEVEKRTKPADYIYTQTEVWTAEKAVEEALEEAKANGDFKGEKGDKGDPGAVRFIVVSSLPQPGEEGVIYLLYNFQSPMNQYDEYIFQNGAWEKIGVANVSVNLDEYVKKTDYAVYGFPGVVRVSNFVSGLQTDDNGYLTLAPANEYTIDGREDLPRAITPKYIDYAVKKVLSDCKVEWTTDEQAAARELVGIESNIFVANPDTTWQEIDDAYSAGKYIYYAVEAWGTMNIVPLLQKASDKTYVFTHTRENKYLYTVKVNKDNSRGIGSVYLVDKFDFDALVARVEALEGKE